MHLRNKFIFGAMFLLALFLLLPKHSKATSIDCQLLSSCPVPAPTVLNIDDGDTFYADQFVIAGVSWSATKVDVYIDDNYNGRAVLRPSDKAITDFYYYPFLDLEPGKHIIYTVARNLNEKARSIESRHIEIFIKKPPIIEKSAKNEESDFSVNLDIINSQQELGTKEAEIIKDNVVVEEVMVNDQQDDRDFTIAPEELGNVNIDTGDFGMIMGGVSKANDGFSNDLQQTANMDDVIKEFFSNDQEVINKQLADKQTKNRNIGFIMLAVVIVTVIIWNIINRDRRTEEKFERMFSESENSIKDKTGKDNNINTGSGL